MCGEADGTAAISTTFTTTSCTIAGYPWSEDFESKALHQCWEVKNTSGTNWMIYPNAGIPRGTAAVYHAAAASTDAYLITQKLAIPETGYSLIFWSNVYNNIVNYDGTENFVEILASEDKTDVSTFTSLKILDKDAGETPQNIWMPFTINLDAYANKEIYIAFRYKTDATNPAAKFNYFVDDISVKKCVDDNLTPTNLKSVPGYNNAVLSWDGTATSFFKVTLNDGENDVVYYTTDKTYTVTGLKDGTEYTWKVAAM